MMIKAPHLRLSSLELRTIKLNSDKHQSPLQLRAQKDTENEEGFRQLLLEKQSLLVFASAFQ